MSKRETIGIVEAKIDKGQKILDKMNPALRSELDWILDWYNDEKQKSITSRWELGCRINEILQDAKQGSKRYGHDAWRRVKFFIDEDETMLRFTAKLADVYTKQQIKEIAEMVMADQMTHISYSHMRLLLCIDNDNKRQEALNLTLLNCWTSSQLGDHVRKINGGVRSNNPAGRGPAVPKNADAVIGQQIDYFKDFENRNIKVWSEPKHSLTAQIEKLQPAEYTDDLAKKLGELAKCMRRLATEAINRAVEAEKRHAEVLKVLNSTKPPIKAIAV